MCGICGLVFADQHPIDPTVVTAMTRTLRHRGPDDEGFHVQPGVGLGHRRLSIIDIAAGHQPIYNEEGSICVICNGEIYNYKDLRRELEARGHVFRTRSDTEVLVHLYEESGPDMVESLSGMFAFAIWDGRTRTLLLVRDPVGQKPLYYAELSDGLVFASEIKAILASGLVERKVDPDGLCDYLALTYTLAPLTAVQGIRQVRAGHLLIWQDGILRSQDYRKAPGASYDTRSQAACEEELRVLLQNAVSRRLMSEVPLGVFLSGGIDSSSVVASMAQLGVAPIKTFGIGFQEKSYDERTYIRLISERFGTEHHEFVVEPDLLNILPDLIHVLDAPFADASSIPMYYLARFARSEVKVALNGDGGDELFGGYPTLQADMLAARYRHLPKGLRRLAAAGVARLPVSLKKVSFDLKARQFVAGVEHPMSEWHYWWRLVTTEQEIESLLSPDVRNACTEPSARERFAALFNEAPSEDRGSRHMYVDFETFLADDILTKADRTTMGHSLEVRSPFLDRQMIAFANRLPFRYKVRHGRTKYIMKRSMSDILPKRVVYRKKQGFNTPVSLWLRDTLRDLLCDTLHERNLREHGLFNTRTVERVIQDHMNRKRDNGMRLWGLLCFQMWYDRFMKQEATRIPHHTEA